MSEEKKIKIYLVDDDKLFLKSLELEFLQETPFEIITFPSGELCILEIASGPDIIVLDYHLSGIDSEALNGIHMLDKIKAYDINIPVIMLSSQDKIEVAIDCMHHLAHDYVVKSETAFLRLQKIISEILQTQKMNKQLNWYKKRM